MFLARVARHGQGKEVFRCTGEALKGAIPFTLSHVGLETAAKSMRRKVQAAVALDVRLGRAESPKAKSNNSNNQLTQLCNPTAKSLRDPLARPHKILCETSRILRTAACQLQQSLSPA